jgi:hypothetical protein
MKVTVKRGGGLTGLVRTTWVDSASLAPQDAGTLRAMVNRSGVFDSTLPVGSATTHPDGFNYAVTVEDAGRHETVLISGGALPQGLRALVDWVQTRPERQEQLGSPG